MNYRAEIDGLRALAVLPVILFHADVELFSGGFVGVDVFFVISGYLITTILIHDIEGHRFSLVNFYERRARRLLPALFLVMLVCIPLAWMWMVPSQMEAFSKSLVAVSLFVSNISFWRESGYFDLATEEKPLLHTWSLAVEEQYYLLFPIFLFLAWRLGKDRVFWVIVSLAAISLLLSEWGWRNAGSANFYLAPTRAWELFAGSIAAFVIREKGVRKSNALSLVGLACVLFAIFAYDEATPFPSVYTLLPVLGVVLIVLFADRGTFVAQLLSVKVLVGIGLISYSTYLWHQPLFAFARIYSVERPSLALMLCLSIVALLLAFFTWRYVETPFRAKGVVSRNSMATVSVLGLVLFVGFGLYGQSTDGFANRPHMKVFADLRYYDKTPDYVRCSSDLTLEPPRLQFCASEQEGVDAIVFGDSHADDKFDGIAQSVGGFDWMLLGNSSCPPLMNVKFVSTDGIECTARMRKAFQYIETKDNLKVVVLSFAHMYPLEKFIAVDHIKRGFKPENGVIVDVEDPDAGRVQAFYAGLKRTVGWLRRKGVAVVVLLDIPELTFMPEDCLRGKVSCLVAKGEVLKRQHALRRQVEGIADAFPSVLVFDPLDMLCAHDVEQCSIIHEGRSLYRDSHHLSRYGGEIYGQYFSKWLNQKGFE